MYRQTPEFQAANTMIGLGTVAGHHGLGHAILWSCPRGFRGQSTCPCRAGPQPREWGMLPPARR